MFPEQNADRAQKEKGLESPRLLEVGTFECRDTVFVDGLIPRRT